jgi:hypothetical protein
MQRFKDTVTDRQGNVLVSATVAVYDDNDALAALFDDNGVTALTNPLSVNAQGEYGFCAANGRYRLVKSAPGYSTQTTTEVVLFDPEDQTITAGDVPYDGTDIYDADSIGSHVQLLESESKILAGTANQITVTLSGDETTLTLALVSPCNVSLLGTTSGTDATTGVVGEEVSANTLATALTTATQANTASLTLQPGEWIISGNIVCTITATTTINYYAGGLSIVSATLPTDEYRHVKWGNGAALGAAPAAAKANIVVPNRRLNISSPQTVYLVGIASFGVSTFTVDGYIRARRVR